jgi:hypothetical protein
MRKVVPVLNHYILRHEGVWGSGCIGPYFLVLDTSWSSVVSFTSEEGACSAHWIRGWVGSRTGLHDVEKRKFFPPPALELRPLGRLVRSQ